MTIPAGCDIALRPAGPGPHPYDVRPGTANARHAPAWVDRRPDGARKGERIINDTVIPDAFIDLFGKLPIAHVATIASDGAPHTTRSGSSSTRASSGEPVLVVVPQREPKQS